MKKVIIILVVVLGLAGCFDTQPRTDLAVEIVKAAPMTILTETTSEEFMGKVAGIHGRLAWKSFKMDGEKNPAIRIVQADVLLENEKTVLVQWEVNTETKAIDLVYIGIDKEGQEDLFTGLANLYLISIGY